MRKHHSANHLKYTLGGWSNSDQSAMANVNSILSDTHIKQLVLLSIIQNWKSEYTVIGLGHAKMCFMAYATNKGADQPAHPCSLISTFVVRCLGSIICILVLSKVSRLQLVSVAEQVGLNLTWSKIPEDTFSRDVAQLTLSWSLDFCWKKNTDKKASFQMEAVSLIIVSAECINVKVQLKQCPKSIHYIPYSDETWNGNYR